MECANPITVFTKPWPNPGLEELADLVGKMGFDGVELAVRPGYQIEPDEAMDALPAAARIFFERGLKIESVATELSTRMVAACREAGVPVLRTMLRVDPQIGYRASVDQFREAAKSLIPELDKGGVEIGVQNHCGAFVGTSAGLISALEPLPESFKAVLDFGHTALCGEPIPFALEIALPRLAMVNLKNAIRVQGPMNAAGEATWTHRWVGGHEGLTPWSEVAEQVSRAGFTGPICLTAEYHDTSGKPLKGEESAERVCRDLEHLRDLLPTSN